MAEIKSLLPSDANFYNDRAWDILDAEAQAVHIQSMVKSALKFWQTNPSSHARYGKRSCKLPSDMNGLLEELNALEEPRLDRNDDSSEDFQKVLQGLEELKLRSAQREQERERQLHLARFKAKCCRRKRNQVQRK